MVANCTQCSCYRVNQSNLVLYCILAEQAINRFYAGHAETDSRLRFDVDAPTLISKF